MAGAQKWGEFMVRVRKSAQKENKRGRGRPPVYTYNQEIAEQLCEGIAQGKPLEQVCNEISKKIGKDFKSEVVYRWLSKYDDFSIKYARANDRKADTYFDQAIEIARNTTPATCNADRLKVDTLKWASARLAPKKYSEKYQITGDGGGPVSLINITEEQAKSICEAVLKTIKCSNC